MRWLAIILPLVLTGCAEWAAKAIEDANYLHQAGRAYVMEVHDARRDIRRICHEMLMAEVKMLEAQGKWQEARARLKANYPALVTFDIAKQAAADPTGLTATPFGCE